MGIKLRNREPFVQETHQSSITMAKDIAITTNFDGQRAERSVKNSEEESAAETKAEKPVPPKTVQKEVNSVPIAPVM